MTRLLFGNIHYRQHGTDECEQLQSGLVAAGWEIAGHGYGDGCKNIPALLKRYEPDIVLCHDWCDWHKDFPGCFDPVVSFENIEALAEHDEIYKVVIVKDVSTMTNRDRVLARAIKANAAVLYYHPNSALPLAPWLNDYRLIRTYHTIDRNACMPLLEAGQSRERAILTGAMGGCYPLRRMVADHSDVVGCQILSHPGYGNIGHRSTDYLKTLAQFKVHIATASQHGCALRKIMESVAVGTTPMTNLPAYDCLPEIDQALVRVPLDPSLREVKEAVDWAEREWSLEKARYFAAEAWSNYDFRVRTAALSREIEDAAVQRIPLESRAG